ncbi:O-methyltransferase [Dehalobacter sp. DCM]|uniref:O-methyltransferase n=1 Tax=Dehalobacter sp. DCM TaxID=2907827 RepID=UPI003081BB9D|nr:O-methyltransferase [Dehalobacter sp. DCM]
MFYPFELEKYLEELLPQRDELLSQMEQTALAETIPVVTPAVGHFLQLLVKTAGAKTILEIGTAIGYSTIYLARGAMETGGKVHTLDMNKHRLERAKEYIHAAGLDSVVTFSCENALTFLPKLTDPMDFVFLDAAKGEYPEYLDLITPHLVSGGLLVVDNVLFRGWVVPDSVFHRKYDRMVGKMRDFLKKLSGLPDFEISILPFGDGIALARKTSEHKEA